MTERTMANLGRVVMWILVVLIHIQFWVGFVATWRPLFPDGSQAIEPLAAFGIMVSVVPTIYVANRVIP